MNDVLDRYIFDAKDIRACCVRLEQTLSDNHGHHHYPEPVKQILAQFMAACVLLSSSLKFSGRLVLQLRSSSRVPLIMAECTDSGTVRAYAQMSGNQAGTLEDFAFSEVLQGTLALTLQPEQGEAYQGIVPLNGENLSECLQHYFRQSEQLQSYFFLHYEKDVCVGFMLQQLPAQIVSDPEERAEQWQEVASLASTLSPGELTGLSSEEIMFRLFHQDDLRFLGQMPITFQCRCSKAKMENVLISLGRDELEEILLEQGQIEIQCEFCQQAYVFGSRDVENFFQEQQTLH